MIKAVFEHKPDFRLRDVVIDTVIRLPKETYERFLRRPCEDYEFIEKHSGLMYMEGKSSVYHCLMITGEGYQDGVLVESEGSSYARYASYVPDATALRYPSLLKMNQELTNAVDFIIDSGTGQTMEGSWMFSFDELKKKTGMCVKGNPYLQKLMEGMLEERPEVAHIAIKDGGFYVEYRPDVCQKETPGQTFRDLIERGIPENTYLVHQQDVGFIPVGILDVGDLKTGILNEFLDLLEAEVISCRSKASGQEIQLGNISADRLIEFDKFLTDTIANTPIQETPRQTLGDLIRVPMEDIHLLHKDVEIASSTIVELSFDTLTEAGKAAWHDVLDATVRRVYQGVYGLQAELEGVKPSRLQEFSAMLAGDCSEENYEKWVAKSETAPAEAPRMKL